MPYLVLKFLHVGAMFVATALAVGPSVLLYLIARNGEPAPIRRAFGYTTSVFRAAGVSYGLGILFGVAAALTGAMDLTARWLVTAYALIGLLIAVNMVFERWTRRVERSIGDQEPLAATTRERAPLYSLTAMVALTLAIVFVMVVKPNVIG
jgi:hypothetical protein